MFHAITPADIQAAFNQPRALDMHLVDAQQARRVLDRLVGYQVSPLLWKSTGGKSAGRVQSVALRLVVEREREIRSFVPQEYWSIHADLAKQIDHTQHFLARLIQIGTQKVGLDQPIHLKTQRGRRAHHRRSGRRDLSRERPQDRAQDAQAVAALHDQHLAAVGFGAAAHVARARR